MDFRNPHFAEPGWLWLAALGPVCVVLLQVYAAERRKRQVALLASPELLEGLIRSHSPGRRLLKHILLVLGMACAGLAMARPQWGETAEISQALGEDILFVLDCSKSMLANDVQPSRLQRSKLAILDFVEKHGRGRVGLLAFAGQGFLQCPLTFDYDAFRESLLAVDENTIGIAGTDIGRALEEGARAMETNDHRKLMVLITDGEDLEKSGVATARRLADSGIIVYAVGVGTEMGGTIHITNYAGAQDVLRDARGNVVQSRLDATTLTEIANATHGSYHALGDMGEGLTAVRRLVEDESRPREQARVRKLGVDRFHFFIAALTALIVIESLIGTRRLWRQNPA